MILCDTDLKKLMKTLVGHEDQALLNPASIDIRVGRWVIDLSKPNRESTGLIDESEQLIDYPIEPKGAVLVSTMEIITIPNGYAGVIYLKSSRAREGFNHALAGFIDPGWSGVLTLELINERTDTPLLIWYGQRIAQLVVYKTTGPSKHPYQGHYQGATTVEGSKAHG
jgi:dCTP deaminase